MINKAYAILIAISMEKKHILNRSEIKLIDFTENVEEKARRMIFKFLFIVC